ncbi:hypothetical protein [Streptomyces sp. NPDC059753]|uniref:hypothetical protein n=1 Tax=Streptomyces sp. NPDC059753 TaxID=3346933 RepID=UPI0036617FB8
MDVILTLSPPGSKRISVPAGLVERRGQIRTDSTHGPAAVRRLNRAMIAENLRDTLEE